MVSATHGRLEKMRKKDNRTRQCCRDRADKHRPGHEVFDYPNIRMNTRLHHVEDALEGRIHELEREDEPTREEKDSPFGAGKGEIPSEKPDRQRDGELKMEIALLTKSVEYTSHRMAKAPKEFMHGFLFLTLVSAAPLPLRGERISDCILNLKHLFLMVETGQVKDAVREDVCELAFP